MVATIQRQSEEVKKVVQEFGCPAFYIKDGKVGIDENICVGCMVCAQITKDIKPKKREQ